MAKALELRPIARHDVEQVATLVAEAFLDYRHFAPAGWRPPPASEFIPGLERRIGDPDFWSEAAYDEQGLLGHVTFFPATRHSVRPTQTTELAHLGQLFVQPRCWGSGLATTLLAHATGAAAERDFGAMRLFTPVGQVRARSFYEREGFVSQGQPFELGLGLPVLEYKRRLTDRWVRQGGRHNWPQNG
jgi:GNAT superfamily N-acetyltransferase